MTRPLTETPSRQTDHVGHGLAGFLNALNDVLLREAHRRRQFCLEVEDLVRLLEVSGSNSQPWRTRSFRSFFGP